MFILASASESRKKLLKGHRFRAEWVLAADTMVAYGGRIYGKPRDRKAAVRLLRSLAGATHTLGTGVILQKGRFRIVKFVTSKVTLHQDPPIEKIVARKDPTQY